MTRRSLLKSRKKSTIWTANTFLMGLVVVLLYPYIRSALMIGNYISSNTLSEDYLWYPILSSNESVKQSEASKKGPYKRHEGVVIVSKMMGHEAEVAMLMQSLCLFTQAYNKNLNYDIVIFSTFYQDEETTNKVSQIVHPAKFRFVYENITIADLMHTMTENRRNFIIEKCNKTSIEDFLDFEMWWERCPDIGSLRYNWQAQFRSLQIWKHEALAEYKTMLWMDCDLFCTRPWNKDPINFFIENDLAVAFDYWPAGRGGYELQKKIKEHFNTTICHVSLDDDGNLTAKTGDNCNGGFSIIGGWFHISNLDFFRSHIDWLEKFIGEDQLSRNPDDQEALTTTALLAAPGKVWNLHAHGMNLSLYHNGDMAGGVLEEPRGFRNWWRRHGRKKFGPEAHDICTPFICCMM